MLFKWYSEELFSKTFYYTNWGSLKKIHCHYAKKKVLKNFKTQKLKIVSKKIHYKNYKKTVRILKSKKIIEIKIPVNIILFNNPPPLKNNLRK